MVRVSKSGLGDRTCDSIASISSPSSIPVCALKGEGLRLGIYFATPSCSGVEFGWMVAPSNRKRMDRESMDWRSQYERMSCS